MSSTLRHKDSTKKAKTPDHKFESDSDDDADVSFSIKAPTGPLEEKKIPASLSVVPALRAALMKGSREYSTVIGLVGSMTTTAAGTINSQVQCATLATLAEFVSFAGLFDEFFITNFVCTYEPFNYFMTSPASNVTGPNYASGLLLGVPLYHGATSYTSASAMACNVDVKCLSSATRWTMRWKNNESPKSTVSSSSTTSAPVPSQGWCLTSATSAALYSGALQFRNSQNFTNVASSTIGDLMIRYHVIFRARA